MNEAKFEMIYQATLVYIEEVLESAIDELEINIDYETVNDILTIECEDTSEIIVTKQGATKQLWLAAVSGGFHFEHVESLEENPAEQWQCTIDQRSLADKLSEICQQQGKVSLEF